MWRREGLGCILKSPYIPDYSGIQLGRGQSDLTERIFDLSPPASPVPPAPQRSAFP